MIDYSLVVLAGGLATRLYPITKKVPKSLIKIDDIPFVIYQLKLFKRNGIKHIHFCLGYLGESIEKVIRESEFYDNLRITFSYDGEEPLGTGGCIQNILNEISDSFIVTYGDSYLNLNYLSILDFFKKKNKESYGLMTVFKNEKKYDTSNAIYKDNMVSIYSKTNILDEMNYIDYGLGILSKKHFKNFKNLKNFDLSEVYEQLSKDSKLLGYESKTRFYEIGSLKGIEDLTNYFKN
jgi:N-acetyl-alpha-D-muramate 1-phosphate uridylyltransferase